MKTIIETLQEYNQEQFTAEDNSPVDINGIDRVSLEILETICDAYSHCIDVEQIIEALETLDNADREDFTMELDGNEYRIIADSAIWGIYKEEIEQIVQDCYDLRLDSLPSFIALEIDWEQTAQNCFVDGYGHTFSTYDFSEYETSKINGDFYYIFRLN